jgi:hypothetical protein
MGRKKQDQDEEFDREDQDLATVDEHALMEMAMAPISVEGLLAAKDSQSMAAAFDELRPTLMARMVLRALQGKDKAACATVYKMLAAPLDMRIKAALLTAPNGARAATIEGQGGSVNNMLDRLLSSGAKLPDNPEQGIRQLKEIVL